jgi:DivIVA domain-containing protein
VGDACRDDKETPEKTAGQTGAPDRNPAIPGQEKTLLTPDDVHHKWFTTVRLREGYDLGQVDTFLHDVEYTLDRLYKEINTLRAHRTRAPQAPGTHPMPQTGTPARAITPADQTLHQTINAAHTQAERILAQARTQAESVTREVRGRAEQTLTEAHSALESLNNSRRALEQQLTVLQTRLAEYRHHLTVTFEQQLDDIERQAGQYRAASPAPAAAHARPVPAPWPIRHPTVLQQNSRPPGTPAADH